MSHRLLPALIIFLLIVSAACDDKGAVSNLQKQHLEQPKPVIVQVHAIQQSETETRLTFSFDGPTTDSEIEGVGIVMDIEVNYLITKKEYEPWVITRGDFDIATIGRYAEVNHRVLIRELCEKEFIGQMFDFNDERQEVQFRYVPSDSDLVSDLATQQTS